jgi:hypothetical protein
MAERRILSLNRIAASIAAGVAGLLAVLSAGTREELFARGNSWWAILDETLGLSRVWTSIDARLAFVTVAVVFGLVAWDVPQRLYRKWKERNDPTAVDRARQRMFRADARDYLLKLYEQKARFAIGELGISLDVTSRVLQHNDADRPRVLLGKLLLEPYRYANNAIQPMLDAKDFDTDSGRDLSLARWGDLFQRYQVAAYWLNEAHEANGIKPWSLTPLGYDKWREYDIKFIDAMRTLEHMEGCQAIVFYLRQAGWGDECRPPRPE